MEGLASYWLKLRRNCDEKYGLIHYDAVDDAYSNGCLLDMTLSIQNYGELEY